MSYKRGTKTNANFKPESIIFCFLLIFFFNLFLISAAEIQEDLHLNIQTINSSDDIVNGTFEFEFNISLTDDCAGIVYTNKTNLTTDSRGIVSYYLDDVSLNYTDQYWLCYYRDGNLTDTTQIARTPYTFSARNVTLSGMDIDTDLDMEAYNITTTGTGFFGWLGSLTNRVTKLFVSEIDFNGTINGSGNIITTGNVTGDYIFADYIGIGTTSPSRRLEINDSTSGDVGIQLENYGGTNARWDLITSGSAGSFSDGSFGIRNDATGDEHFTITNTGLVGINTTAPTHALNVVGDVNITGDLIVEGSNITGDYVPYTGATQNVDLGANNFTVDTNVLHVDSDTNKVGIGTTAPSRNLEINDSTSGDVGIQLENYGGTNARWDLITSGSAGSFSDGSFGIRNDATGDEHFTITNTGDVGIGTTSPLELFQVGDNSSEEQFLSFQTSNSHDRGIRYYLSDGTTVRGEVRWDSNENLILKGDELRINVADGNNALVVDSNKNVGIGTTTPSQTLDVRGDGNFSGTIYINNDTDVSTFVSSVDLNDSYVPYTGATQNVDLGDNNLTVNGTTFHVDSSTGNIGIGTDSPSQKLEVDGIVKINDDIHLTDGEGLKWGGVSTYSLIYDGSNMILTNDGNRLIVGTTHVVVDDDLNLIVDGGDVGIGTTTPSDKLHVNTTGNANALVVNDSAGYVGIGTDSPGYELDVAGNIGFDEYLYHNEDPDTSIRSAGDDWQFRAGGIYFLKMHETTQNEVTFNEGQEDVDFRIESYPDSYSFFLEGSSGNIGIGTTTPSAKLEINASDAALDIQNESGSSKFFVNTTSGNVGIGNAAPDKKLTINQSADDSGIKIYGYDDQNASYGTIDIASNGRMHLESSDTMEFYNSGIKLAITNSRVASYANFASYGLTTYGSSDNYAIGFNSGDDTLRMAYGDDITTAPVVTITNSSNVGIGTTSPSGKLHVNTTGNENALVVNDSDGYVGIGETAPSKNLHITAATGNAELRIEDDDNNLVVDVVAAGTQGAIGTQTNHPFSLQVNAGNKLTIDTDGEVGIGTTSPSAPLHINDTDEGLIISDTWYNYYIGTNSVEEGNYFSLLKNSGNTEFQQAGGEEEWRFTTDGTRVLTIDSSGQVGIGTTTPSQTLDVRGDGNFSGTIYINNDTDVSSWEQNVSYGDIFVNETGDTMTGPLVIDDDSDYSLNVSGDLYVNGTSGYVGIGTASPEAKLDVRDDLWVTTSNDEFYLKLDANALSADSVNFIGAGNKTFLQYDYSVAAGYPTTVGASDGRVILNGNVGIGTTDPTHELNVVGDANITGDLIVGGSNLSDIYVDETGDTMTGPLVIDDSSDYALNVSGDLYVNGTSGNVGIGTSFPSSKLVVSQESAPTITINNENSTLSAGELIGSLQWYTNDISATGEGVSGKIDLVSEDSTRASGMHFYTTSYAGANLVERMVIDMNGNIGMGTNATSNRLQVDAASTDVFTGDNNASLSVSHNIGGWGRFANIDFRASAPNLEVNTPTARVGAKINSDGSLLYFGTSNNLSNGITNEAVVIDSSGNVGINTTAPTHALNVDGDANITGDLFIGGSNLSDIYVDETGDTMTGPLVIDDSSDYALNVSGDLYVNGTSGNVGIGTSSPSQALEVNGTVRISDSTSPKLTFDNEDSYPGYISKNESGMYIFAGGVNDPLIFQADVGAGGPTNVTKIYGAGNSRLQMEDDAKLSFGGAAYSYITNQTNAFNLLISSYQDLNITESYGSGSYEFFADSIYSGGYYGAFNFKTKGTPDAPLTTKLFIGDNVGIGTTSPSGKFHVNTTGNANALVVNDSTGYVGIGNESPSSQFEIKATSNDASLVKIVGSSSHTNPVFQIVDPDGSEFLRLYPHTNEAGSAYIFDTKTTLTTGNILLLRNNGEEKVTVKGSGNIGINTTEPTQLLHVEGNANVTQNLSVGESLIFVEGGDMIFRI